jgi:arylformamidase
VGFLAHVAPQTVFVRNVVEHGLFAGELLDVSVTVRSRMPIYEGNPGVSIKLVQSLEDGDPANVSRVELGAHTGTHVDAPRHFFDDGAGADQLPLEPFIGPSMVVDATAAAGPIDSHFIDGLGLPPGTERVLLKTRNSRLWERDRFTKDFVRLDGSGAAALVRNGIRLVGIDYLSIGDRDAHVELLGHGVSIVEGLNLGEVEPGSYFVVCLSMKIGGCDGAPARVILWPVETCPANSSTVISKRAT